MKISCCFSFQSSSSSTILSAVLLSKGKAEVTAVWEENKTVSWLALGLRWLHCSDKADNPWKSSLVCSMDEKTLGAISFDGSLLLREICVCLCSLEVNATLLNARRTGKLPLSTYLAAGSSVTSSTVASKLPTFCSLPDPFNSREKQFTSWNSKIKIADSRAPYSHVVAEINT